MRRKLYLPGMRVTTPLGRGFVVGIEDGMLLLADAFGTWDVKVTDRHTRPDLTHIGTRALVEAGREDVA